MREDPQVNRTPVRSSNIRSVSYDAGTKTLEVEFHSGGVYHYSGVPETVHQGFIRAASKGSYFHANIKDRYPDRQV
jgi:hypothetical protein